MDRTIEQLIHVLQRCEALYQGMLLLFETEKKAALGSSPSVLIQVNDEKEVLLAELQMLEGQRTALLKEIAAQLALSVDRLTMSALIENVPAPFRDRLKPVYDALQRTVTKVQYTNNESRLLMNHCLALVRNTLGFFSRWTTSAAVYGASGRMQTPGRGHGRLLSDSV